MSDDDDDLMYAIDEDAGHCDLCGAPFAPGGGLDRVTVDHDGPGDWYSHGPRLELCCGCARKVHDAYRANLRAVGICEHGVEDGGRCEDCDREYVRARLAQDDGIDEEGDW